jgi:hypothetical protein
MQSAVVEKYSGYRLAEDNPFGERLYKSIAYLDFKSRSANATAACETIEKMVAGQKKYKLFREIFPEEWDSSHTSFYKTGSYKNYSERANELFELINEKCFPLFSGWNDDPDAEFERFTIFSMNFDICCDEIYYEDSRVSYLAGLLFYFRDEELWEYFAEMHGVTAADFPRIKSDPHESLWTAEKTPENEIYLDLFRLVDHSTGNPWLDTTNCQGGDWFSLDRETINLLTEAYKDAIKIFEQLPELDERIKADPRGTLLDLITLWNEGDLAFRKNRIGRLGRSKTRK